MKLIANDQEHEDALAEFDRLADDEAGNEMRLIELRDAINHYELAAGHAPAPVRTLVGRLEVEMFRRRMKQKQLAALLEVPESRFSEIMKGRRSMNLDFARRLWQKLNIPAEEVLQLI